MSIGKLSHFCSFFRILNENIGIEKDRGTLGTREIL